MNASARRLILHAVFFASGAAGLGYELVWTRMFAVGLGHELPAALAVVAAFFGGVALGAWALDARVSVSRRPGYWYAALEAVIGVWGLLTISLIPTLNEMVGRWIGISPSFARHWFVAFGAPLVVLLPATAAMGATFAAMDRLAAPLTREGHAVGGLYAANTAGAVVGVIACTFMLQPALGMRATLALLAIANLGCALIVFVMSRGDSVATSDAPVSSLKSTRARSTNLMTVLIFSTGLLGIGYEVLGLRMLAQIIENSVYSFAAVLSVYLIGTAAGAAWYQRFGARLADDRRLAWLLCCLAGTCAVGAFLLSGAFGVYLSVREMLGDSLAAVAAAEMSIAAMTFLPPTFFMGVVFSHLAQSCRGERGGVGKALAINTVGAAAAPVLFGVLLLPDIGARLSFGIVIAGYVALSLVLGARRSRAMMFVQVVVLLAAAVLPEFHGGALPQGDRMVKYDQGVIASVAVIEDAKGDKLLRVNNRFQMGGTSASRVELRQGDIPLLLHPDPKRALFLGLGTGITFRAAAAYPGLTADGVELVPEVASALPYFETDDPATKWDAQRMHVYVADARRFVTATDKHYDVIVADFFHPGRDGAGSLYTEAHFRAVRGRLTDGGLFCQWLPLYQLDEPTLKLIIRTFLQVFPEARAFVMNLKLQLPGLALIGQSSPTMYPPDWYEHRVRDKRLHAHLESVGLEDGYRLFGLYLASADQLRAFAGAGPINTDNRPLVTFDAPRFTYQRAANGYGRLMTMIDHVRTDVNTLIDANTTDSGAFRDGLSRYIEARDVYLHGLVDDVNGRRDSAIAAYIKSARISGEFTTGYAQCLMLAMQMLSEKPAQAQSLLRELVDAQPQRREAGALLERINEALRDQADSEQTPSPTQR